MSAFGTKRTSLFALHMSALGGKADMTMSATGLKRDINELSLVTLPLM